MTIMQGADSELPQPGLEGGKEIWGVYIAGDVGHVWTKGEIEGLGRVGVRAVLPIVIPPQSPQGDAGWWWAEDEGAKRIVLLVAEARAWGLAGGSPLCFDIEEGTAEAMLKVDPALPGKVEARIFAACAAYGYHAWTYGGLTWHNAVKDHKSHRWLAHWSKASGEEGPAPTTLEGYGAIQYAGNVQNGRIDLDLFQGGLEYMGCDGVPALFGEAEQAPKAHDELVTTGTTAEAGSAPLSDSTSEEPSPSADDTSSSSPSVEESGAPVEISPPEVAEPDPLDPPSDVPSEPGAPSAPVAGSGATSEPTEPTVAKAGISAFLHKLANDIIDVIEQLEKNE